MHTQTSPYHHSFIAVLFISLLLQNCSQLNQEFGNMEASNANERFIKTTDRVSSPFYGPFVASSGALVTFQQKENSWTARVEETGTPAREQHLGVGCTGDITKTLSQLQHQPADYAKLRIHVLSPFQSPTGKGAVYLGKLGLSGGMKQGGEESNTSTLPSLHQAAQEGNLVALKYLVEEKEADVNARDDFESTALHWAARGGHLAIVKYLVGEKKANANARDSRRSTALHWAAEKGHLAVIQYLAGEKNTDMNAQDDFERTALHLAALKGHLAVIKYLVEKKKVDVNARDRWGVTALHWAAEKGHLVVLKYLVEGKEVDVNARDDFERTALHWAAEQGHLAVIQYLTEAKNANVDAQNYWGTTVLHYAAQEGHLAVIKYLVEDRKVDVNARDNRGMTALHCAAQGGNLEIILYLMEEAKGAHNPRIIETLGCSCFEQWENIGLYARLIAFADRLYSKEGPQALRPEETSAITDASLKLKLAYKGQKRKPSKECPHDLGTAFSNRFKNRIRREGVPEAMLLDPEAYFRNILPPDSLIIEIQAFVDFVKTGRELYILYASSLVALLEASEEISSTPLNFIVYPPGNFRPYNPENLVQKRTVEFYTQRSTQLAKLIENAEDADRALSPEEIQRALCKYLLTYLSQLEPHAEIIKALVEDGARKDLVVNQIESMLVEDNVLLPIGLKARLALLLKELLTPSAP